MTQPSTLTPPLTDAQRSPQRLALDLTQHDKPSPRSARQVLADDIAALTAAMSHGQVTRVISSLSVDEV